MSNVTLRRLEDQLVYEKALARGLTRNLRLIKPIAEYKYWSLVPNDYPYTMVYKTHDMLLARELAADWDDLSEKAKQEYYSIRRDFLLDAYDQIFENCPKLRSVNNVYHIHLVQFYDSRDEIRL